MSSSSITSSGRRKIDDAQQRRIRSKFVTKLIASLALALLAPGLAFAECSSIPLRDSVRPAAVAFSGTVTEVATSTASEWRPTIVTFEVERVWKGSVTRRFAVYSFTRTPEGLNFVAGKKYVVFAHDPTTQEREDLQLTVTTQTFVVGQCGDESEEIANIGAGDLAELGPGTAPVP